MAARTRTTSQAGDAGDTPPAAADALPADGDADRTVGPEAGVELAEASNARVAEAAAEERDRGYRGNVTDPTPREAYTVAGVTGTELHTPEELRRPGDTPPLPTVTEDGTLRITGGPAGMAGTAVDQGGGHPDRAGTADQGPAGDAGDGANGDQPAPGAGTDEGGQ